LVLGCGLGCDAIRYARTGTSVTVGLAAGDSALLVQDNFARHGLTAAFVPLTGARLPFGPGAFDVVTWNALYDPAATDPARIDELFRVLKPGGKVIGLFPAHYDPTFWRKLVPLPRLFWPDTPDPTTTPKTTARELRHRFGRFADHRVAKRHLRRAELPVPWRLLPVTLLERVLGRVLVLKAKKPIPAARVLVSRAGRVAA
ncbi:MAG: class I SAM-dependent methyltransferase, partial [Gemmataceae bacterium]|nr:class I SAM-dependent methyltransferase [Gemmataceae bacterium]